MTYTPDALETSLLETLLVLEALEPLMKLNICFFNNQSSEPSIWLTPWTITRCNLNCPTQMLCARKCRASVLPLKVGLRQHLEPAAAGLLYAVACRWAKQPQGEGPCMPEKLMRKGSSADGTKLDGLVSTAEWQTLNRPLPIIDNPKLSTRRGAALTTDVC